MTALVDRHTHGAHNLAEAADYLYRLRRNSPNVGLTRANALLERLGNPQNAVPTVHVAGTAGKGSVSAFTSAVLTAHGFRVGTHLSPHVRSILERFQINGASVCAADFVEAVRALGSAVESLAQTTVGEPTFFEALNAVAFTRFADAELDYAVIETGLGGLLDATNTIQRQDKLAVLTRIGIDHTKVLGATVAEIAAHKAGILPTGGQGIVVRHHQASVRDTIADAARSRHCHLDVVDPGEVSCTVDAAGTILHFDGRKFPLGLQGHHQAVNAVLALRAVHHLARRDGWALDLAAVRTGLANTWLPGRFERHTVDGRALILDGAHNSVKLAALVDTVRALHPGCRVTWVVASKADKDIRAVLAAIAPIAASVIATQLPHDADGPTAPSMSAARISELAQARGLRAVAVDHPADAIGMALRTGDGPIVVTGSFLHLAAADRYLATITSDRPQILRGRHLHTTRLV